MMLLRTAYGSGPLENFNVGSILYRGARSVLLQSLSASQDQLYRYRRNVAASITLVLFAVQEALTTRLHLPQYLPSARLAHLRLINKVRKVVQAQPEQTRKACVKWTAWNASTAARAEIIEYVEELADLTKLLVGCNEFRSGLLMRPTYHEYVEKIGIKRQDHQYDGTTSAYERNSSTSSTTIEGSRRRSLWSVPSRQEATEEIPLSLQRIRSRVSEKKGSISFLS